MKKNSIISLVELLNDEYAVGNAEGRAVFQKLAQHIDNNPAQVVFGISLKGVKFTDASFPRESVISIAKLYRAEKGFYLTDFLDKDLIDNWDYAAKAKEQPLIIWDGGRFTLIGPNINNSVRELLEYVNKQGEVTTSKVAAEFDLSSQNASGKLKKMFESGLILGSKQVAESGGHEFVYRAIKQIA